MPILKYSETFNYSTCRLYSPSGFDASFCTGAVAIYPSFVATEQTWVQLHLEGAARMRAVKTRVVSRAEKMSDNWDLYSSGGHRDRSACDLS